MSMLRNLHRAYASNNSGYVCRTCQYKLSAALRQQTRSKSDAKPSPEPIDDWFANFNDLSTGGSLKAKRIHSSGEAKDLKIEKKVKSLRAKGLDRVTLSFEQKHALEREGPHASRNNGEKTSHPRAERTASGGDFNNLRSILSDRLATTGNVEHTSSSQGLSPVGADENTIQNPTAPAVELSNDPRRARIQRRRRREREYRKLKRQRLAQEKRQSEEDVQAGEVGATAPTDGKAIENRPKGQQLEDIVRQLKEEFRIKLPEMIRAVANGKKIAQQQESSARPRRRRRSNGRSKSLANEPNMTETTEIGDKNEASTSETRNLEGLAERLQTSKPLISPSDTTADNKTTFPTLEKEPERIGLPNFVKTSLHAPPFRRMAEPSKYSQPMSLIQNFEESRNRPAWGGVAVTTRADTNLVANVGGSSQHQPEGAAETLTNPERELKQQDKSAGPLATADQKGPSIHPYGSLTMSDQDYAPEDIQITNLNELQIGKDTPQRHDTADMKVTDNMRKVFDTGPNQANTDVRQDSAAERQNQPVGQQAASPGQGESIEVAMKKPTEKPLEKSDRRKLRRTRSNVARAKDVVRKFTASDAGGGGRSTSRWKAFQLRETALETYQASKTRTHATGKADTKAQGRATTASTPSKGRTRSRAPRKVRAGTKSTSASSDEVTMGTEAGNPTETLSSSPLVMSGSSTSDVVSVNPSDLEIQSIDIPQPRVPGLEYGLDRVLFSSGVYQLQDPHSRVYNFDPYLQKIMPVVDFDYNALKTYKTSSQDSALSALAKEHGKRYIGSTSSMTGTLGHFHYLLSNFRPINLSMLSRGFPDKVDTFTNINKAPNAIFLRTKGDGAYAIDADKEYDGANVLMMLGKSMEKLLTVPTAEYERYRKENSHSVSEEERSAPEAYQYTTMGDFLMRSQLDAHDPRLPGTGVFDLKTRAVVSVRMNTDDFKPMTGYEIHSLQGRFESYEREQYDMMRSTMLKYMLQVRMGRMDGIFIAYHNVERIFGFQYVPLHEMDRALHGQTDPCLGDQEFKISLEMLNKVFDKATAKFPKQSLRFHFEASEQSIGTGSDTTVMWIYAEPMAEDEIDHIQDKQKAKIAEFERTMMGMEQIVDDQTDVAVGSTDTPEAIQASEDAAETTDRSNTATTAVTDNNNSENVKASAADDVGNYSSTNADADPNFATKIEPVAPADLKPLFAASIICKSQVDGSVRVRPEQLKPDDKWEVEYLLQEWETNAAMWARYEDTKTTRKRIIEKYRDDEKSKAADDNGSGDGNGQKKEKGYIAFLKSRSEQGRLFRGKMDQLEAGKAPVVFGQPLHAAEGNV